MTFNIKGLCDILEETTIQLRKGPEITEAEKYGIKVVEIYDMPHVDQAKPELIKVDLIFLFVGVHKKKAEARKEELISILKNYPNPERLKDGPSYIEVGHDLGSQSLAFQLFALGKVLGLWDVITPRILNIKDEAKLREMAGIGFVMISGYDVNR